MEQVARQPRVRDRAIYLGEPDDLVPEPFGPGLPAIPAWTREHFTTTGYVAPYDPADYVDAPAVRARLGYAPDQPLIVIAVGGTAIGEPLLRKAIAAWPLIHAQRPDARCSRSRARASIRQACRGTRAWTSAGTCPTSTSTSPSATSQSCRAG